MEIAALDQFENLLLENYSKYFDDLLSGERLLPFGLLVDLSPKTTDEGQLKQMREGLRFFFCVCVCLKSEVWKTFDIWFAF